MARAFNTSTKLGKLLQKSGLKKLELGYASGINERILTELLAGRRKFTNSELVRLCAVLQCEAKDIEEDQNP